MKLPDQYNYIACFITLRCNYSCSYCINWKRKWKERDTSYWISSLSRIETNLPVTFCGGESTLRNDLYGIINSIPQKVDLLTNLSFDPYKFIDSINPEKFDNTKSFAPIRASFHSEMTDLKSYLTRLHILLDAGFRVGVYLVDSHENKNAIDELKHYDTLDVQIKPLLPNKKNSSNHHTAYCRTRELLISPNGNVFNCHRDLYENENSKSSLDTINSISYSFHECFNSSQCHPCDLKVKRDRFGNYGYSAVEKRLMTSHQQ